MACIVNSGCGVIDACSNLTHVLHGAAKVIVGGDDCEAIGGAAVVKSLPVLAKAGWAALRERARMQRSMSSLMLAAPVGVIPVEEK